jgi:hypothetical protein
VIAMALAECRDENEKLKAQLHRAEHIAASCQQKLYEAEQREAGLRVLLRAIEKEGDLEHALGIALASRVQMEANR